MQIKSALISLSLFFGNEFRKDMIFQVAYSFIFSYLKNKYNGETPISRFILLSSIIRKITSYPKEIQYIIFEVMHGINSENVGYIVYLFRKLSSTIEFSSLKPVWRE